MSDPGRPYKNGLIITHIVIAGVRSVALSTLTTKYKVS